MTNGGYTIFVTRIGLLITSPCWKIKLKKVFNLLNEQICTLHHPYNCYFGIDELLCNLVIEMYLMYPFDTMFQKDRLFLN